MGPRPSSTPRPDLPPELAGLCYNCLEDHIRAFCTNKARCFVVVRRATSPVLASAPGALSSENSLGVTEPDDGEGLQPPGRGRRFRTSLPLLPYPIQISHQVIIPSAPPPNRSPDGRSNDGDNWHNGHPCDWDDDSFGNPSHASPPPPPGPILGTCQNRRRLHGRQHRRSAAPDSELTAKTLLPHRQVWRPARASPVPVVPVQCTFLSR